VEQSTNRVARFAAGYVRVGAGRQAGARWRAVGARGTRTRAPRAQTRCLCSCTSHARLAPPAPKVSRRMFLCPTSVALFLLCELLL